MRKSLILAICLFSFAFAYAEQEPKRPSNVPKEAVWEVAFWKHYDEKGKILYHWYSNGKLRSKGPIKNGKTHGKAVYWSPDGTIIMEIKYDYGVEKKRKNYKIVIPDLQRPLHLPLGAAWDSKNNGWSFYKIKKRMLYTWYIDGEKMMQGEWVNNKLIGIFIRWFKNGVKMIEGNYNDGKEHGKFIYRYKDGTIRHARYFKNGRKIWSNSYNKKAPKNLPKSVVWHEQLKGWKLVKDNVQYIYTDDGRLKHKTEMKGLDYHGETISYFPTGQVMIKGKFVESSKEGEWKYYYYNGQVGRIETYKNDKVIKTENFKKK